MTLDVLKSEVLKLQTPELFDFVEFILHTLKEEETKGEFITPDWLKTEIRKRAAEMKIDSKNTFLGEDIHQEIIKKYGFNIPTSLLS
jgi:hypothetical protein